MKMPFGPYKGWDIESVPDDYLLCLHNQHKLRGELRQYVRENLEGIEKNVGENVNCTDND